VHTEETFHFVANASLERVAPLFGAYKEREWAPGWNPSFVWPPRADDREGMVFTVTGEHGTAVWINTAFEPASGRIQYVYVLPNTMATLITLKLRSEGQQTHVTVVYQRTALDAGSSVLVRRMADQDARAGPEWARQINDHLSVDAADAAVRG
jgi:hypothetical protein